MRDYITRAWWWILGLSTLGGCYLGAAALKAEWAFFVIVAVALLFAGFRPVGHFFATLAVRYRSYPTLIAEQTRLEASTASLTKQVTELEAFAEAEYKRGNRDAEARTVGSRLAGQMSAMPRIRALSTDDGEVALVAAYSAAEAPPLGAWLQLEVVGTGEVKGALEVVKVVEEDRVLILRCAEQTVPIYWSRLLTRAREDTEPPKGVRLVPYPQPGSEAKVSRPPSTKEIFNGS